MSILVLINLINVEVEDEGVKVDYCGLGMLEKIDIDFDLFGRIRPNNKLKK